jgi:hypothetical protein
LTAKGAGIVFEVAYAFGNPRFTAIVHLVVRYLGL